MWDTFIIIKFTDPVVAYKFLRRLKVSCEGTHLHYIYPHQFVDSPEWESSHESSEDMFQVTLDEAFTALAFSARAERPDGRCRSPLRQRRRASASSGPESSCRELFGIELHLRLYSTISLVSTHSTTELDVKNGEKICKCLNLLEIISIE